MITKLIVENFKAFEKYCMSLGQTNLLVGGNNSGKTTIFHALQIFFWCVDHTVEIQNDKAIFKKTQIPEIGAIPYFSAKDLFHDQKTRLKGKPTRIVLQLETTVAPPITFEIYPAFSRNLMIDGKDLKISKSKFDNLKELKPIFIPSTVGIIPQEELYREIAQERLISEGKHNQVLRNMIYRLSKSNAWDEYKTIMQPLFDLGDIQVPFDENKDEWLNAIYQEGECEFDFIAAGSGFLQVSNIVSFLLLHPCKVALLDEPDSHMHDDLQRLIFDMLKNLAEKKKLQLLISTHSPTLIDNAELESLYVIDKSEKEPLRPKNVDNLIHVLSNRGVGLPPRKITSILAGRRILFVEGIEADYENFIKIFGQKIDDNFIVKTRNLTIFETEGPTMQWPFDTIKSFQKLIGVPVRYVYLADRDFKTENQINDSIERAQRESHKLHFLSYRNRESYLLNPMVIARILSNKRRQAGKTRGTPSLLTEKGLKKYILDSARGREDETRSKYLMYQNRYIKGSESEKQTKLTEINKCFSMYYTQKLQRNEIPYLFMDSKEILKFLRSEIASRYKICFSDKDVFLEYKKEETPQEIKDIVTDILGMF
jgi:energy-coupling factor transporter ATP-binding protein EcfA2